MTTNRTYEEEMNPVKLLERIMRDKVLDEYSELIDVDSFKEVEKHYDDQRCKEV